MNAEQTVVKTTIAPTKIDILWIVTPDCGNNVVEAVKIDHRVKQLNKYLSHEIFPTATFGLPAFQKAVEQYRPRLVVIEPDVQCADLDDIKNSGFETMRVMREANTKTTTAPDSVKTARVAPTKTTSQVRRV